MTAANILKNDNFISEDDARQCADYISPHLQELIDYAVEKYKNHEAVSCALQWEFASILSRLGDSHRLKLFGRAYKVAPESECADARDCKQRLQQIVLEAKRRGFGEATIGFVVLGPLSKCHAEVYRALLPPEQIEKDADQVREILLTDLRNALLRNAIMATVN